MTTQPENKSQPKTSKVGMTTTATTTTPSTTPKRFDSVMFDVQSMGPRPDGVMVTISAFLFDQNTVESEELLENIYSAGSNVINERDPVIRPRTFYAVVSLQSALDAGFQVNAESLRWWMRQNDEVRAPLRSAGTSLNHVLTVLDRFLAPHRVDRGGMPRIWSDRSHIAVSMLEDAYRIMNVECPWDADRAPRDLQSVIDVIQNIWSLERSQIEELMPRIGVTTHPLSRAMNRAAWLQRMMATAGAANGFLHHKVTP